jgi:hypothetical protein
MSKIDDDFISNLIEPSDLCQRYVDLVFDEIDSLSREDRLKLADKISKHKADNAEEAGAVAMILFIIKDINDDEDQNNEDQNN